MYLIDVHIIHQPGEDAQWWKQCEDSLYGHPINVFHIDGKVGDIYYGREQGYRQGSAPYVSFVDPDDVVMPGAFERCLEEIQTGDYCGVYTMSEEIQATRPTKLIHEYRPWELRNTIYNLLEIHQVCVMKREMVIDALDNYSHYFKASASFEFILNALLSIKKPWKAVDMIGYQWRRHDGGLHKALHGNMKQTFDTLSQIYRSRRIK